MRRLGSVRLHNQRKDFTHFSPLGLVHTLHRTVPCRSIFFTFSPFNDTTTTHFNAFQWKFYLTDQSLYLALLNQIQRPPFSYSSKSCCFYKLSHLETKIFAHSSFQKSSSSVTLEGEQLWTSVWAPSHMCLCRIKFTSTLWRGYSSTLI